MFSFQKFFILSIAAVLPVSVTSRIAYPNKGKLRALESEQFPYLLVGENLECPLDALDGRMFKNVETASIEECYDRCYGLQSCNFFSYQASTNTCVGCTLEDDTKLVEEAGLNSYQMLTMKSASDFGYELWNGVEGIGKKCPFRKNGVQHEDRIVKKFEKTKEECLQHCEEDEECQWFSWGEDEVQREEWEGNCMLCREDDEVQAHLGFNFWSLLKDEAPTKSPTDSPTNSPTKTSCPGDVELVMHHGVTLCEEDVISIISQDVTTVTIKLTQTCTPPGSEAFIDFVFWQYMQDVFTEKCFGSDEVHGGEITEITIQCSQLNQEALLHLWVVDDVNKGLLTEGDDAVVPECCHADLPAGIGAYRAVYAINCASTC